MRILAVIARAFGPFSNQRLGFAPGFTIIYGPNEAGKSRWHMALYAGLCGMRRGRGAQRLDDRDFQERHRPWDGDHWQVATQVLLEDGRRVELRHDLDGRVDSSAKDLDLGRDYSNEIIHEGSPDGSRWLGLDRKSFLATACVRQADLLGLREDASALQTYLQRAATLSRADTTAAEALKRLEEFKKENVGTFWATTKPLRTATDRLENARGALTHARDKHEDYLRLAARAEELERKSHETDEALRLFKAARARQEAVSWERHLERAYALGEKFEEGPPTDAVADDALAQLVGTALERWEARPPSIHLDGRTADDLRRQIAALPAMPSGDLEPEPGLATGAAQFQEANRALQTHRGMQPAQAKELNASQVTQDELRELIDTLERPLGGSDGDAERELSAAQARVAEARAKRGNRTLLFAGIAVALLGGLAAVANTYALLLVGVGLVIAVLGILWKNHSAEAKALEALRKLEAEVGPARFAAQQTADARTRAITRIGELGLVARPDALRHLMNDLEAMAGSRRDLDRWRQRESDLLRVADDAAHKLRLALELQGVVADDNVGGAFTQYEGECRQRSAVAAQARLRPDLEKHLTEREQAELAAIQAERQRAQAAERLRQAAEACGVTGETEEGIAEGLGRWQQQRSETMTTRSQARDEWMELQTLLDHRSVADLERETTERQDLAATLAEGIDEEALDRVTFEEDVNAQLLRLQHQADESSSAASVAKGSVQQQAAQLPSVSEAEEELAAAQAELGRVKQLERTLDLTREFLEKAQDRVHRDIAPVLAETIRTALPKLTRGRYVDVTVDPQSLDVLVRGPDKPWRRGNLLSEGTAEQIYLLLRTAMAKHLTKPPEVCPLILDDVTVQCDDDRKLAVLMLLHEISRERQVILFSQETDVANWAMENLKDPQDRLIRLDPSLVRA